MNSELEKLKGPVEYIKEAWGIYTKKENFIFFAKIMAVLVIISTGLGYLMAYLYPWADWKNLDLYESKTYIFLFLSLLSIIVGLWSQTTQYFAILNISKSEKEIFRLGYKNMVKFFLVSLVVGLIIVLGLILLIIPAIIFGIWYSFSIWLVLDRGLKIGEALKTSKTMVKGRFWKILGRSFAFGLFTLLVSIITSVIPYAGSLIASFVAPLFMLPFYLLYKDLSASSRL